MGPHGLGQQLFEARVVGGGERGEGQLLMTAGRQLSFGHGRDLLRRALPHRPVPHARLTEAAPPRAPPHDLHPGPIVHPGGQRHQARFRIGRALQTRQDSTRHGVAQSGHVDPGDEAQPPLGLGPRDPLPLGFHHDRKDLREQLLAVAHGHGIEKPAQGEEIGRQPARPRSREDAPPSARMRAAERPPDRAIPGRSCS